MTTVGRVETFMTDEALSEEVGRSHEVTRHEGDATFGGHEHDLIHIQGGKDLKLG